MWTPLRENPSPFSGPATEPGRVAPVTGPTRPGSAKGFTLVELLVILTIIIVIAGLAIPALFIARKKSQITAQQSNFQTLISAMENYRTDFRDYPKCGYAMTDIYNPGSQPPPLTTSPQDVYRPDPARVDGSLAMALLGPGPAGLTINNAGAVGVSSGYYTGTAPNLNCDMDGADGPGFRSRFSVWGAATIASSGAAVGATSIGIPGPISGTPLGTLAALPISNYSASLPLPTAISLGGPGSPDAHVPITSWTDHSVNLAVPLQQSYPANSLVSLLTPAGKTWGPYLPADKFKVAYITGNFAAVNQPLFLKDAVPVLLDNWGNQILYFPAYNNYGNHVTPGISQVPTVGTPTIKVSATYALIGPLIGSVSGNPAACQYNTGLESPQATGGQLTGPAVFWDGAANYYLSSSSSASSISTTGGYYLTPITTGQIEAILWHLGDNDEEETAFGPNNAINAGEKLAIDAQYFFVSAGPDGKFEDLVADKTGSPNISRASFITKSDDIYSFHP